MASTPHRGEAGVLDSLRVTKLSDVINNVKYASLDAELFEAFENRENIEMLEESLARFWFFRGHTDFRLIVKLSGEISSYERRLREGKISGSQTKEGESIRRPAFRRVVTQVYDYRCAATGVRILLPSGEAMVEAAHIHPFSVAADDDPCNGLALTPNIHWAMDKFLIAPGPDLLWHVSRILDRRIPDFEILTRLDGMPLLLPKELRFTPKMESLVWRLERLRR